MKRIKGFLLVLSLSIVCIGGAHASDTNLPKNMIWSCYDVGSTGYVQASAVANAFLKKYDIRVRLIPSGTSIGRVMPLVAQRASVGFLANEAYFASEGSYDFATYSWGPQDLMAIAGRPTSFPLITTKVSGIKNASDLKGKKVSWVVGNPSLNVKMTAILAFANLTWDDVEKVEFPGYAPALKGLIQGSVDASVGSTTASILYELETSKNGIYYPQLDPNDKEGWDRLQQIIPFAFPYKENVGAGIDKEQPLYLLGYRYPIVTVRTDADADFVYNFIKALDETYPLYKDAAASMPPWDLSLSGTPPVDVPFHDGAIKYLKEKGLWKKSHQAWNEKMLSKIEKIKTKWEMAITEGQNKKMKQKDFKKYWMKELSQLSE